MDRIFKINDNNNQKEKYSCQKGKNNKVEFQKNPKLRKKLK